MDKPFIAVGAEDFKELREYNALYVDKTLLIKDLVASIPAKVKLFLRPRRFGKTLTLSMLRYFFSDEEGNDPKKLFSGLKIMEPGNEQAQEMMGRYPVVFLTLKDVEGDTYKDAFSNLKGAIHDAYVPHISILDKLDEEERKTFLGFKDETAPAETYDRSLRLLSEYLKKATGRSPIILLDEYDVPLNTAHLHGYYDKMAGTIRGLFSSTFKSNPYLEFAVITGCLQVSKEAIFTGMNNLAVFSVTSRFFTSSFGFTEDEVAGLFKLYGLEDKLSEAKAWYDGYKIDKDMVYTPWSVLQYLANLQKDRNADPEDYWVGTSGNDILRSMCEKERDEQVREDIATLAEGKTITRKIRSSGVTYGNLYDDASSLFTTLLYTGYVTIVRKEGKDTYKLRVPNREVLDAYRKTVTSYLKDTVYKADKHLLDAVKEGSAEKLTAFVDERLQQTLSVRDTGKGKENGYHLFLAGLFGAMRNVWAVRSQLEGGDGYPDLTIEADGYSVVIECKVADAPNHLTRAAKEGLEQALKLDYKRNLQEGRIDVYGVGFYGKHCKFVKQGD